MAGILSSRAVLINALLWYCASAIFVGIIAWKTSPIIWAIWGAVALCTFWYSWGKLHYQCELALGFGFGPLAVMLGMATQPNPDFLRAFLAGLPFLVLWGWAAEFVDQATDAEPNWPRGLRNLGAIAWRTGVSIPMMTAWLFAVSYLVQFALVMLDVIPAMSLLSLFAIPFMAYGVVLYGETDKFRKVGVLLLLSAILLHMIAFVVGLVLS